MSEIFLQNRSKSVVNYADMSDEVREMYDAIVACLPDLKHYVSTHGTGPDIRLNRLQTALADIQI